MRAMVLATVLTCGCYLGPSRGQRTTALVTNGVIATAGGLLVGFTAAVRSSQDSDEPGAFQLRSNGEGYWIGGGMIGLAAVGAIVDVLAPTPRSPPDR